MIKKDIKISNKKYKINYLRILFIGFAIYFAIVFTTQQLEINEYNVKIQDASSKIEEYETETKQLKNIETNINDGEYIEKIAREELGLVKPYEKIFVDINK